MADRTTKGQFAAGNGGRPAGARNRLQGDFLKALADDFKVHGEAVIRIVRVEKPAEYLKIIGSILPKEILLTETAFDGLSDDDLAAAIMDIRKVRAAARDDDATEH